MNQNQIQEISNTQPRDPINKNNINKTENNSNMYYRGGLIGAAITAFASWNTGRYNRIGHYIRRWKLIRHLVSIKPIQQLSLITNYHMPHLNINADNFYCYSGQAGIGKSFHFKYQIQKQSYIRPTLYVSFKSTGRQDNFQNDLAEQLNFGQGAGIIAQIIKAVNKIKQINQNPFKFRFKYVCTQIFFMGIYGLIFQSNLNVYLNCFLYSSAFLSHAYYCHFMGPLLEQCSRATIPILIFDDLNKIEQLNMLAQIVRFLKIIQDETANIILVSSDEETWSKLRRQPGMKDRLRIRNIKYDHIETANKMIQLLHKNVHLFKLNMTPNAILNVQFLKGMINQLIGQRQMCIRRFKSLIRLVDEQRCELYIQIFKNQNQLIASDVIKTFRELFFDFQAETMVMNLKTIKRQLPNISLNDYFSNLELLLKKKTLTSDNTIAPNLKLYNIVRDLKSQYVITGRYTEIVFEMALKKYKQDIKEYELKGQKINQ